MNKYKQNRNDEIIVTGNIILYKHSHFIVRNIDIIKINKYYPTGMTSLIHAKQIKVFVLLVGYLNGVKNTIPVSQKIRVGFIICEF